MDNEQIPKYTVERRKAIRIQECWAYITEHPKDFNVKIAETLDELVLAFDRMGFHPRRLDENAVLYFLPHHIVLLGRYKQEPIALASLHIGSYYGLPIYRNRPGLLSEIGDRFHKPAEIRFLRFMAETDYRGILSDLMAILWFVSGFCGVDFVLFSETELPDPIPELLDNYGFEKEGDLILNPRPEFESEFIKREYRRFDADLYKFFTKYHLMERDMIKWQRTIFTPSILGYFLKDIELQKDVLRRLMFYYPFWDFSTILTQEQLDKLGYSYVERDPSPGDRIYQ